MSPATVSSKGRPSPARVDPWGDGSPPPLVETDKGLPPGETGQRPTTNPCMSILVGFRGEPFPGYGLRSRFLCLDPQSSGKKTGIVTTINDTLDPIL